MEKELEALCNLVEPQLKSTDYLLYVGSSIENQAGEMHRLSRRVNMSFELMTAMFFNMMQEPEMCAAILAAADKHNTGGFEVLQTQRSN